MWACSHHRLCNIPTALSEWLQLRLGSLLANIPVPAMGDGGCMNSVTPTASFSLQLVCICKCVSESQLWEQLSTVTCFICAHTQRWAQTAPLKVCLTYESQHHSYRSRGSSLGKYCSNSQRTTKEEEKHLNWYDVNNTFSFPCFRSKILKKKDVS